MDFQTLHKQRKFILIAAAVGVVAMFLPWVSFSLGAFSGGSVNGLHGSGVLIFLCFIACAVIAYLGEQEKPLEKTMWMISLIASGLAAALMIFDFLRALDAISFLSIGFYLALAASLALVFSVYQYRGAGLNVKDGFDSLKKDIEDKTKGDTTSV
jgi:uncharacterized membrane protein